MTTQGASFVVHFPPFVDLIELNGLVMYTECRLCDKVFQVQFSVIPSGGFGEVQVFNEVIDGSIPVQGILEMLAEKVSMCFLLSC